MIIARASGCRLEKAAKDCNRLFRNHTDLFASENVIEEVTWIRNRRMPYYREFIDHLLSGHGAASFNLSGMNDNDVNYFTKLVNALGRMKKEDQLEFVRLLLRLIKFGIQDSINKLARPIIPKSGDTRFQSRLEQEAKIHKEDAVIIDDFVKWGISVTDRHFVTIDSNSINNEARIQNVIKSHFGTSNWQLKFLPVDKVA